MSTIAILAYGSLVDDPGPELTPLIVDRRTVSTPFRVEYARASRRRGGAPTLIPVTDCGSEVTAILLVLDPRVSESEAKDMLWRRETGRPGSYVPRPNPGPNHVLIDVFSDLVGIPVVLSTRIGGNIHPLTGQELALRAVGSAKNPAIKRPEDGISYLLRAKGLSRRSRPSTKRRYFYSLARSRWKTLFFQFRHMHTTETSNHRFQLTAGRHEK